MIEAACGGEMLFQVTHQTPAFSSTSMIPESSLEVTRTFSVTRQMKCLEN